MTAKVKDRVTLPERLRRIWVGLVLIVIGLAIFAPLWWTFITSVSPSSIQFSNPPHWFISPTRWDFSAYSSMFSLIPFGRQLVNSVIVLVCVVVGSLVVSTMAAYAFARIRFRGAGAVFLVYLAGMMIPPTVILIPLYVMIRELGMLDTLASLIVPSLIQVFSIFMLRQHFMSLPGDLDEAAQLDGAGRMRTLFQIYVPVSMPIISALSIFVGEAAWNNFMTPNVFLTSPENMTLPVGMVSLQNQFGTTPAAVVFAAVTVVVVPLLILFLFTQRKLTEGLSLAGVSR